MTMANDTHCGGSTSSSQSRFFDRIGRLPPPTGMSLLVVMALLAGFVLVGGAAGILDRSGPACDG